MAVACGLCVTAAVTEGGALFTWGLNTFGQLGLGTLAHQQQPSSWHWEQGRKVDLDLHIVYLGTGGTGKDSYLLGIPTVDLR